MVFITGDTHNTVDISNASNKRIKEYCNAVGKNFSDVHVLIILGDFGLPWEKCEIDDNGIHPHHGDDRYLLKWYNEKPFTVLALNWWEQELWSETEQNSCLKRISENQKQIDYVLSHTGTTAGIKSTASSKIELYDLEPYLQDPTVKFNDKADSLISYKKWFFGHLHCDWGAFHFNESQYIPLFHEGVGI